MRIEKVRNKLDELSLDSAIFTNLISIRYLCGYSGSNGILFISKNDAFFFTDFRYKTQAPEEVTNAEIIVPEDGLLIDNLAKRSEIEKIKRIGFEKSITWGALEDMKKKLPETLEWIPMEDFVAEFRAAKTEEEIKKIIRSIEIAETAMRMALTTLKPGIVEREFAADIEYFMRREGADKSSFDIIVVSGIRGSFVHGTPSDKIISYGDMVIVDFGAVVDCYSSDITRTYIIGQPSAKQRDVYETVYRAQIEAIKVAKAGMVGKELDKVARDIIAEAGYGEYFGHGLGHGLGLLVHDPPRVGMLSESIIPENAVITIEPGIYIPDFGGVRIEDDVLITEEGCEVLTSLPKNIDEIIIERL